MSNYHDLKESGLFASVLFYGLSEKEMKYFCEMCVIEQRTYRRGTLIVEEDEPMTEVGFVREGRIKAETLDSQGKRHILSVRGHGDIFGLDSMISGREMCSMSLSAMEATSVVYMHLREFLDTDCPLEMKAKINLNISRVLAEEKNRLLMKADILSCRRTRDRILRMLAVMQQRQGTQIIAMPLTREQIAEYICVDRSGLICELQRLQSDGIIELEDGKVILKSDCPR